MNQTIQQKVDELNHKLRNISEEQYKNQLAIQKQEQREVEFDRLKGQSNRLFDRILETWYKDRELGQVFLHMRQDVQHIERKLTNELEDRKETLRKEKQNLSEQEDTLYYERQKLSEQVES